MRQWIESRQAEQAIEAANAWMRADTANITPRVTRT